MFQIQIDGEMLLRSSGMTFKYQRTFQIKRFMSSSADDVLAGCSLSVGVLCNSRPHVDHKVVHVTSNKVEKRTLRVFSSYFLSFIFYCHKRPFQQLLQPLVTLSVPNKDSRLQYRFKKFSRGLLDSEHP